MQMFKVSFIHFTNAPTQDAANSVLTDIDAPVSESRAKTNVFFHDESTFMSNEDQSSQWGFKGEKMLKLKSGINVIDFVDEHNGFLALSDTENQVAKCKHPNIREYT